MYPMKWFHVELGQFPPLRYGGCLTFLELESIVTKQAVYLAARLCITTWGRCDPFSEQETNNQPTT
jgi:hypothetical protein